MVEGRVDDDVGCTEGVAKMLEKSREKNRK